ncbi:unnamed protein product [Rhizophagus irregularis]|nr:unnamed protein product [Rhizophagus irregularis]
MGTEKDEKKAFEWNHKDDEKALEYFIKSAQGGYSSAQNILGDYYQMKPKQKILKRLFTANQEYLDAQFELGNCYEKGIGTDSNRTKAFELYK